MGLCQGWMDISKSEPAKSDPFLYEELFAKGGFERRRTRNEI